MKFLIIFLSLIYFSNYLYSSEVDSFYRRFENLNDSTDVINKFSNQLFDNVIDTTNQLQTGCNEYVLYENIRKEFHNHIYGQFSKYICKSKDIDRVQIKTSESIYADFTMVESLILGFYSKFFSDSLGSLINVSGHLVGTDKFEHFAGTGFKYFKKHYLQKKSIAETLMIGFDAERGLLGSNTTGVMSYGDMVAEFNGMRFWNHILAKNPDILGQEFGPYIKCENHQWIKNKSIDFSQYVDDGWDEGINCSKFKTEKMLQKMKKRISKLEEKSFGNILTCPMNTESVPKLQSKYRDFAPMLLNFSWGVVD